MENHVLVNSNKNAATRYTLQLNDLLSNELKSSVIVDYLVIVNYLVIENDDGQPDVLPFQSAAAAPPRGRQKQVTGLRELHVTFHHNLWIAGRPPQTVHRQLQRHTSLFF